MDYLGNESLPWLLAAIYAVYLPVFFLTKR
jgi:hypothetical protein